MIKQIILYIALKLGFKSSDKANSRNQIERNRKAFMTTNPKMIHIIGNSSEWYTDKANFFMYTWMTPDEAIAQKPITEFWWRDNGSPQGYGPFNSPVACMDHHAWLIRLAKANNSGAIQTPGKVLRVDFNAKKRVDV